MDRPSIPAVDAHLAGFVVAVAGEFDAVEAGVDFGDFLGGLFGWALLFFVPLRFGIMEMQKTDGYTPFNRLRVADDFKHPTILQAANY